MYIEYSNRKTAQDLLSSIHNAAVPPVDVMRPWRNRLIQGDNLCILKALAMDQALAGRVDLVYIDPPFATNGLFTMASDRVSTISKGQDETLAYSDTLIGPDYLEYIRACLLLLNRLLSDKGSIYLHIDYKIGHYIKLLMDEVFGRECFRNDITRIKCNPKNFNRKGYGNIKDMILFYAKSPDATWNGSMTEVSPADRKRLYRKTDSNGRLYTTIPLHAPGETANGKTGQAWRGINPPKGRHWRADPAVLEELDQQGLIEWSATGVPRKKIYADERKGMKRQDIWEFKDPQYPTYPTEKNLGLLKCIVEASSNPGDLVLDCFCGSGTTLMAAQRSGRRWIGIDRSDQAINVTQQRIRDILSPEGMKMEYEFIPSEEH